MGDVLGFSHEEVERAARYHRPLYLAALADLLLGVAVLGALAVWWDGVGGLPWAAAAAVDAAVVVGATTAVRLPLSYWRGFVRERRWGFSTQSARGWAADRAKGFLVGVVLTALAWVAAVGLARALPRWWPVAAGAALALAVLVLSFVAPLVLEPLFNRFDPLADARLADELRALATRAGVPVRDVLVADASRRTTKVNAYVSGIGATRRVVLYDTLLERAGEPELKVVVAHELGHRVERHVAKGTALGMAGGVAAVAVLWAVLGAHVAEPARLPEALLLVTALELVGMPFGAALSRRWERVADRWSLRLTDAPAAFERAFRELSSANLPDLAPPRLAYLLLFSHPTPPERIAAARAWERLPLLDGVRR